MTTNRAAAEALTGKTLETPRQIKDAIKDLEQLNEELGQSDGRATALGYLYAWRNECAEMLAAAEGYVSAPKFVPVAAERSPLELAQAELRYCGDDKCDKSIWWMDASGTMRKSRYRTMRGFLTAYIARLQEGVAIHRAD